MRPVGSGRAGPGQRLLALASGPPWTRCRSCSSQDLDDTRPPAPSPTTGGALGGQGGQEPGGDRVELADVTEVNERRNEPSVEGAYARSKTRPIPPCRSSAMSSMLSAPATSILATREAHLQPGVRALVARDAEGAHRPGPQAQQRRPAPAPGPAQPPTPDSGRRHRGPRPARVKRVHPQRCPSGSVDWSRRNPNLPARQGICCFCAALTRPSSSVDRGRCSTCTGRKKSSSAGSSWRMYEPQVSPAGEVRSPFTGHRASRALRATPDLLEWSGGLEATPCSEATSAHSFARPSSSMARVKQAWTFGGTGYMHQPRHVSESLASAVTRGRRQVDRQTGHRVRDLPTLGATARAAQSPQCTRGERFAGTVCSRHTPRPPPPRASIKSAPTPVV